MVSTINLSTKMVDYWEEIGMNKQLQIIELENNTSVLYDQICFRYGTRVYFDCSMIYLLDFVGHWTFLCLCLNHNSVSNFVATVDLYSFDFQSLLEKDPEPWD